MLQRWQTANLVNTIQVVVFCAGRGLSKACKMEFLELVMSNVGFDENVFHGSNLNVSTQQVFRAGRGLSKACKIGFGVRISAMEVSKVEVGWQYGCKQ